MIFHDNAGKKRIKNSTDMLNSLSAKLDDPGNNDAFYGKLDCFLTEMEELIKSYNKQE